MIRYKYKININPLRLEVIMKILEREQMTETQKEIFDFFNKPMLETSFTLEQIVELFKSAGIIVE